MLVWPKKKVWRFFFLIIREQHINTSLTKTVKVEFCFAESTMKAWSTNPREPSTLIVLRAYPNYDGKLPTVVCGVFQVSPVAVEGRLSSPSKAVNVNIFMILTFFQSTALEDVMPEPLSPLSFLHFQILLASALVAHFRKMISLPEIYEKKSSRCASFFRPYQFSEMSNQPG